MSASAVECRRRLVSLLRRAHAGELAAALAYRGHWRSVRDADERARIREIEEEELHHRRQVAEMLGALGVRPSRLGERRAALIGRTLGALCHVAGWLPPMYGAGRLESRNIRESFFRATGVLLTAKTRAPQRANAAGG